MVNKKIDILKKIQEGMSIDETKGEVKKDINQDLIVVGEVMKEIEEPKAILLDGIEEISLNQEGTKTNLDLKISFTNKRKKRRTRGINTDEKMKQLNNMEFSRHPNVKDEKIWQ